MSLSKKLAAVRKKPRHVRERILLVSMIVIAGILIVVWYLTYRYDPITVSKDFADDVVNSLSKPFNDPAYDEAFKAPSYEKLSGDEQAEQGQ